MRASFTRLIALAVVLASTAACGLKGDLYLEQPESPPSQAGTPPVVDEQNSSDDEAWVDRIELEQQPAEDGAGLAESAQTEPNEEIKGSTQDPQQPAPYTEQDALSDAVNSGQAGSPIVKFEEQPAQPDNEDEKQPDKTAPAE